MVNSFVAPRIAGESESSFWFVIPALKCRAIIRSPLTGLQNHSVPNAAASGSFKIAFYSQSSHSPSFPLQTDQVFRHKPKTALAELHSYEP